MRRHFVQIDGELVEVTDAPVPEPVVDSGALWGDRHYDIGDPRFSTRTQHRAYLKAHNATVMDDYKGEWARKAQARAEHFTGKVTAGSHRADILAAFDRLAAGHKPQRVEFDE